MTLFVLVASLPQSDKGHMDYVSMPLSEFLLLNGQLDQLTHPGIYTEVKTSSTSRDMWC